MNRFTGVKDLARRAPKAHDLAETVKRIPPFMGGSCGVQRSDPGALNGTQFLYGATNGANKR